MEEALFSLLNKMIPDLKWAPLSQNPYFSWKSKVGARDQRFRLDYKGRLYDMENDPGQRTEVSKKFPKVFKKLSQEVNKYKEEVWLNWEQMTDLCDWALRMLSGLKFLPGMACPLEK